MTCPRVSDASSRSWRPLPALRHAHLVRRPPRPTHLESATLKEMHCRLGTGRTSTAAMLSQQERFDLICSWQTSRRYDVARWRENHTPGGVYITQLSGDPLQHPCLENDPQYRPLRVGRSSSTRGRMLFSICRLAMTLHTLPLSTWLHASGACVSLPGASGPKRIFLQLLGPLAAVVTSPCPGVA